jgi:streptogramin lyase
VIGVALGYGSIWALDSAGSLNRISLSTGHVVKQISTAVGNAYNVFIGAGSVWVAGDSSAEVVRVSPVGNRVVAHIRVGDGPADIAFQGSSAWVIDHRDLTLYRIDTRTNVATLLATLDVANAAPERIALLDGSLWITGRGADLLRVDPGTGAVKAVVEIGASGIDLVTASGALWVPVRSAAVDQSGFPTMDALRRVSPAGAVKTVVRPTGRVDVHGLVAAGGSVWLADNTAGVLYRVPTS